MGSSLRDDFGLGIDGERWGTPHNYPLILYYVIPSLPRDLLVIYTADNGTPSEEILRLRFTSLRMTYKYNSTLFTFHLSPFTLSVYPSLPISTHNYPKNNKNRHCEELHQYTYLIRYTFYAILWQSTAEIIPH